MTMDKTEWRDIDHYISSLPEQVAGLANKIRAVISENAPDAVPSIAYNMPAYKYLGKPLVYFAAFTNHIGFYALPSGNDAFKAQLSKYKTGKGSIQFPLSQPMPFDLIRDIVRYRVQEVEMTAKAKKK